MRAAACTKGRIGLRAPRTNLEWDWRTTDLDVVSEQRSAREGTLFVNATSRDGRRRLELLLAGAPVTTT